MTEGAQITSVRTRGFRSVVDSEWVELTDDITVLVGPNGAGKTNFMKSLSYLDTTVDISHKQTKFQDQEGRSPDLRPEISVQISGPVKYSEPLNALLQPVSVESVSLPENKANIDYPVIIERNASGTHTVRDRGNRRGIIELVSIRIEEIEEITSKIEELVSAYSDNMKNSKLQETLTSYKKLVENEIENFEEENEIKEDFKDQFSQDLVEEYKFLKNLNSDINVLIEKLDKIKEIKESEMLAIPAVHYFNDQEPIEDKISIDNWDNSEAYSSLFEIAGLPGGDKDLSEYSTSQIEQQLSRAERDLTTLLNKYLTVDKPMEDSISQAVTDPTDGRFTVEISVEEDEDTQFVSLDVSDTAEKGFTTHPTERSTGARWLLSFLLGLIKLSSTEDGPGLVVYDDPGLPLHPEWKRQLRRVLYAVDTEYQVIYSTHSPFLIQNDQADQVRVVRNHGASEYGDTADCGTKLSLLNNTSGSDYVHDRLDPVRSSLGAPIAESLFGGDQNIVVEGPTDRQYLEAFSSLFEDSHEELSFDQNSHLMSGNGSNADVLANFLEVEQPDYVVLTDSDTGGEAIRNSMQESGISEAKYLDITSAVPNLTVGNPEIEDLLPRELVCQYVARNAEVNEKELLEDVQEYSSWAIVDLVESRYDVVFPKKDVARKISGEVDTDWLNPSNESRLDSSLNFAFLIHAVRSRLNSV